ncbi:MAG: ATPase, partial [Nanoarchaeota archaeon]
MLDNTSEPLTGRKYVYYLYPLFAKEIYKSKVDYLKYFDENLVFGTYPEMQSLNSFNEKISLLKELSTSYLYKDIL